MLRYVFFIFSKKLRFDLFCSAVFVLNGKAEWFEKSCCAFLTVKTYLSKVAGSIWFNGLSS